MSTARCGVAVIHGGAGATDAPVGPDVLDGLALGRCEVLARAEAHERRIEAAVVAGVEEQPGFWMSISAGGAVLSVRSGLTTRFMYSDGVGGVAGGGIEAGFGLDELDVVFKLLRTAAGMRAICESLSVVIGGLKGGDEAFPGVDAVRMGLRAPGGRFRRPPRCCCAGGRWRPLELEATPGWPPAGVWILAAARGGPGRFQTDWPARWSRAWTGSRDRRARPRRWPEASSRRRQWPACPGPARDGR